jgi:hypothetical protein
VAKSKGNLRYAAAIVVCSLVYYFVASLVLARLPFVSVPPAWLAHGLSPMTAVVAWFQLLNVLGCMLAAIPVSIAIVWASPRYTQLFAFAVSMITATVVVGRLFDSDMSPTDHPSVAYWINFGVLFIAFLLAIPLVVFVVSKSLNSFRLRRAT